ncbi:MAG: nucleotidyl transferase AbiEii/AbiGii toxin family protein [Gammaproteobacteria bacterium]
MYDYLVNKLASYGANKDEKYNYLREYLQLLILKILDEKNFFQQMAFVGGTALRILYDLNRFSEDLDFSLTKKENFDFNSMTNTILHQLKKQNFVVDALIKEYKTVVSSFVKFNNLLPELGLSAHKDQKLSVKIEIDCNPPSGFRTELTMINKEFLIGINHYDLSSLFSGKLHAILCRSYTKGRDFYDLLWFIARNTQPNYELLNHAIVQTEHQSLDLDRNILNDLLRERIEKTNFQKVLEDTQPFLIDPNERRFFQKDYFLKLIK